jgi:hypothetical protein
LRSGRYRGRARRRDVVTSRRGGSVGSRIVNRYNLDRRSVQNHLESQICRTRVTLRNVNKTRRSYQQDRLKFVVEDRYGGGRRRRQDG